MSTASPAPARDSTRPPEPAKQRLTRVLAEQFDFVWRLLRRLGVEPGRTDDEAQRVFLIADKKLGLVAPDAERSFLIGVVLRVAVNARRSQQRQREDCQGELLDRFLDPAPTQEELLDMKRRRELLDRLLDELSFEQRTVFVLGELEGMSREEISRHLELPLGTVASRLRLARQHFHRQVARLKARAASSQPRRVP